MQIKTDVKLNYHDVLIEPKRSTLNSRKDVNLNRNHQFRYSPKLYKGIPIMASNMDGVSTFQMAKVLAGYRLFTVINKHYCLKDWDVWFKTNDENRENHIPLTSRAHLAVSTGTNYIHDKDAEDYALVKNLLEKYPELNYICIDIANAYTENVAQFVAQVREDFPKKVIIAGNVCTPEMTEQLIISGADIVKVGIGGGCLTGDTRILMADGTYKNILNVKTNDRVINKDGKPVTVKQQFQSGYKKVQEVKTSCFHKPLRITPDHKCFIGDLSGISKKDITYKTTLEQKTTNDESRLKWKEISKLKEGTLLSPLHINFELPKEFSYDISPYFIQNNIKEHYNLEIKSDYALGYMFGFFLGDDSSRIRISSGEVKWTLDLTDDKEKLINIICEVTGETPKVKTEKNVIRVLLHSTQWTRIFNEFYNSEGKKLPEKYLCLNKQYNNGLYDGLIASDGYKNKTSEIEYFSNTSESVIELLYFLSWVINKGLPSSGNIKSTSQERYSSLKNSFRLNSLKHPKCQMIDNAYFVVKQLSQSEKGEVFVPVYDLEIDDETHSFIANNIIVHNSVCTTRLMTGVGVPQLSAVIECADAAHGLDGKIIADGNCVYPGDIVKAFGGGADFVMLGGMLAGYEEGYTKEQWNASPTHVDFYGMSSDKAMELHGQRKSGYRGSEGRHIRIPKRESISLTVEEILGGIRSACTLIGAKRIKDIPKCTTFIRTTAQLNMTFQEYF